MTMENEDKQFESEFGWLFRELGQGGTNCPDNEQLLAWSAGELGADESARISEHIAACAECAPLSEKLLGQPQPVDDMTWARARRSLDKRDSPWRIKRASKTRWAGLAAAGVAIVAVALVWFQTGPPTGIAPVTRSISSLSVMSPIGTVSRLEFRWQTVPVHEAYVVEVAKGDDLIVSREVSRPPLPANETLLRDLQSGSTYRWRVRATDRQGHTVAESDWVEFQLGE